VSDEETGLIEKYVEKHKIGFPIARLGSGEFEKAIGVTGFPTSALIDPRGKLVWTGHPAMADGKIGDALKGSKKTPLLPAALADVEKLLDKKQFGAAHGALAQLKDGGKLAQADAAAAQALLDYIEKRSEALHRQIADGITAEDFFGAWRAMNQLATGFVPMPGATEAVAKVEEWKQDPAMMAEVDAGEKLAEAAELEDEGEFEAAYKIYKAIVKKHKDTKGAARAAAKARELDEGAKRKIDKSCGECRQLGRACVRHSKG